MDAAVGTDGTALETPFDTCRRARQALIGPLDPLLLDYVSDLNPRNVVDTYRWPEVVKAAGDYDPQLIRNHLARMNSPPS